MIPINELQAKIYQVLSELNVKVYDEVPEDAKLPLVSISDYSFTEEETKCEGYVFDWKIDIYTEYEGKKQVNILVSETIDKLYKLLDADLSERFSITSVLVNNVNVSRAEDGFYIANIVVNIEI